MADDIVQESAPLFTLSQAAEMLGMSETDWSMTAMIDQGIIASVRLPDGTARIPKSAIDTYRRLIALRGELTPLEVEYPEEWGYGRGSHEVPQTASILGFRDQFLQTIRRLEPEVLGTLARDVYPQYRDVAVHQSEYAAEQWAVFEGLLPWKARWHLDAEWLAGHATASLVNWYQTDKAGGSNPADDPDRNWGIKYTMVEMPILPDAIRNRLQMLPYDPSYVTWETVEKEMRKAFRIHLERYKQHVRTLIQDRGLVPRKWKTNMEHFEWLVRYQVREERYKTIADSVEYSSSINRSGVQQAVKRLAGLLDIELRKLTNRRK